MSSPSFIMRHAITGIRARLLTLVIGVGIPLALVGLMGIWAMWDASREQLDESIKKQAEIAAFAFKQWVDNQREPLATVAAYVAEEPTLGPDFLKRLRLIVGTRSHWVGLRVVDAAGNTSVAQPTGAPLLSRSIADDLFMQIRERQWAIETDWSGANSRGIIMIAVPVDGGGAVVGQVDVAAVNDFFLREVKISNQAVFSVFGPQGRIIRSPMPESYLGKDMSDPRFFAALNNQPTAIVELKSPIDGVWRVYGLARVGETGCLAIVGLPSETLYAPARRQFYRYIFLSVVGLGLAVVAALVIARGVILPVRRLSQAARRFGSGDLSTRATFNSSGEVEELRASFNSMAAQIEERAARLAELDRLKSDFVSGVSHEMRTPLTTIKALTRVLQRGKVSEEDRCNFLDTIAAECDRQIDLVLNLLDLSRIEAGTFNIALAPVDVADVINTCVMIEHHNAEAHRHQLLAELPGELPAVLADRTALRRVLCGLVENAIKYTPDGGRITIKGGVEGGEVRISISDTGCGILPEDIAHIFEKFYRGRAPVAMPSGTAVAGVTETVGGPGVGLGLYLARNIIEEVGGRITVESEAGRGSTFTIHLPACREG